MKIFVCHSSNYDFQNELYKPLSESELNRKHEIFLPQKDGSEPVTRDIVRNSEIVLAEVSYPSTGQGIELGWANIFEKPIICIHKEGKLASRSLKKITDEFIEYKNTEDMIKKLEEVIANRR